MTTRGHFSLGSRIEVTEVASEAHTPLLCFRSDPQPLVAEQTEPAVPLAS